MHLEVELKFPVPDWAVVRRQLEELGARFVEPVEQVDTYFAHPARDFAHTDEALRLRQVGDATWITYKGPRLDIQTKTRRELELPLVPGRAEFERYSELLAALGFRTVASVRKRRVAARLAWEGLQVDAALDSVAQVGEFIELEISADSADLAGLEAAQAAVASLAKRLDLSQPQRRSYLELLLLATAASKVPEGSQSP
jgi:adenylate cyclase class 2